MGRLRALRIAAHLVPFLTVPVALYALSSGWAAIGLYHAGMLAFGWALGLETPARSLYKGANLPVLAALTAVCLASGGALYVLWPFLSSGGDRLDTVLAELGLGGPAWFGFFAYYALVNPWLEELYWRGVLGSQSRAPAWTDVCFAGYHPLVLLVLVPAHWAAVSFVALVGVAWVWRLVATRYGGLAIPCITHFAADLSIIVAGHFLAFGAP